jgi:hypothetical protein
MKDFVKKVVVGDGVSPSEDCRNSLNRNFANAVNVEWFKREDHFEAVFYRNNLEHIAIFGLSGILTEYRLNLPTDYLPDPIKKTVSSRGEIMNSVMRNKGNRVEYEVIIRDSDLKRHMVTLSVIGSIIEEQNL